MEPVFNIAVCGGGNLAHGSIACIGHNNPHYKISIMSRRPELWKKEIVGYTKGSSWENKGDIKGSIVKSSSNAADVVPGADIILICSPAHTKNEILR